MPLHQMRARFSHIPPAYSRGSLDGLINSPPAYTATEFEEPTLEEDPFSDYGDGSYSSSKPHIKFADSTEGQKAIHHLRRFLLEIMAYTFSTNIMELHTALGQEPSADDSNSILTLNESEYLSSLAVMAKDLRSKLISKQWHITSRCDREVVCDAILKPARALDLDGAYALWLIGSYADHQCDPRKRKCTIVSRWTPTFHRFWPSKSPTMWCLRDILCSHAKVISSASPNGNARLLLGQSMAKFQRDLKLKEVKSENKLCFCFDDGYRELKETLDPWAKEYWE